MSLLISESKKDFGKPSLGMVQAVCRGVWDIGYQRGSWEGQEIIQPKIIISWEIDELMTKEKYAGKRFVINGWFTRSLSSKGKLRPLLESWRGKPFTKEELSGFDIEKLIGVNCLLNLGESKTGKIIVLSANPVMKGTEKMIPENSSEMPDWVKEFLDKAILPEAVESVHAKNDEEIPF